VVLTPSRRQRRRREAGVGRKSEANLCTEEHEPRSRLDDLGELAKDGEARHHQQGRQVNAAGVEGK